MQISIRHSAIRLLATWATIGVATAAASEYYVSPSGLDTNSGTDAAPFKTISKAISVVSAAHTPGDTVWVHGGVYTSSTALSIGSSLDGTAANPYKLFAVPGEAPILDFRSETYSATNSGQKGISLNGDYWHLKGLTIQYAADNGISIGGSHNIVEQVVARQNQDSGFQISGTLPSNNLILNCDSYGNFDFGAGGENADGFAIKFRNLGPGNVIDGARSYNNGDDGFDFWQAENRITVTNSWSFHNGLSTVFNITSGYQGDGNGIKLGHDSGTHVLENMLVWGNPAHGVDINGNATQLEGDPPTIAHGVQVYNVTAASNAGKNFNFDENPTTASPPTNHFLRNNVSFMGGGTTVMTGNTADHNTFNGPVGSPAGLGATAADFVSIIDPVTTNASFHPAGTGGDRSGATMPVYATGPAVGSRQADGSLPLLDYLRLKPGSHLIDAGVDVGMPFNGTAPDLGYLETTPPIVYSAADFNTDTHVDDADLAIWSDHFGATTGAQPTEGDAEANGDVAGGDFLAWQQQWNPAAGAGGGATTIPEPATAALVASFVTCFQVRLKRRRVIRQGHADGDLGRGARR